jgi:peptide-methionine (R)-S-oxide reductase
MKPRFPVTRSDAEWRKLLNPDQYMVMRRFGTEAAGSCALNHEKRAGTFICAGCDQPLFLPTTKYESNTGWPSFTHPVDGAVGTKKDPVYGDLHPAEAIQDECGQGRQAQEVVGNVHFRIDV